MKKLVVGLVVVGLLLASAFVARFRLIAYGMGLFVGPPELVESGDPGPDTRWFDDYYTIQAIDTHTFAIAEPRYWQKNVVDLQKRAATMAKVKDEFIEDPYPAWTWIGVTELVVPGTRAEIKVTARVPS